MKEFFQQNSFLHIIRHWNEVEFNNNNNQAYDLQLIVELPCAIVLISFYEHDPLVRDCDDQFSSLSFHARALWPDGSTKSADEGHKIWKLFNIVHIKLKFINLIKIQITRNSSRKADFWYVTVPNASMLFATECNKGKAVGENLDKLYGDWLPWCRLTSSSSHHHHRLLQDVGVVVVVV